MVQRAINSVLSQSYSNYELIIVDDGSTDDTPQIVNIFKDKIKFIQQENLGVSAARNKGIEISAHEYITFLDSDDLWEPEKLEKQLKYMLNNGYAFSYTSFKQKYLDGNLFESNDVSSFYGDVFYDFISEWKICTPCVMLERAALGKKRFLENIFMGEDICLWLSFLWRYKGGAVPDFLTTVRVRSDSTSQSIEKRKKALYTVIGYLSDNYSNEECMLYIGLLIDKFRDLFPIIQINEVAKIDAKQIDSLIQPKDYLLRLLIARKKYGIIGLSKILFKRLFSRT